MDKKHKKWLNLINGLFDKVDSMIWDLRDIARSIKEDIEDITEALHNETND